MRTKRDRSQKGKTLELITRCLQNPYEMERHLNYLRTMPSVLQLRVKRKLRTLSEKKLALVARNGLTALTTTELRQLFLHANDLEKLRRAGVKK